MGIRSPLVHRKASIEAVVWTETGCLGRQRPPIRCQPENRETLRVEGDAYQGRTGTGVTLLDSWRPESDCLPAPSSGAP